MKIRFHRTSSIYIALIVIWASAAGAQLPTPFQIAPSEPILNEFGQPKSGPHIPEDQRPLVQLLSIPDDVPIQPPLNNGTPHEVHEILYTSSIGSGAIDGSPIAGAGRFNISLDAIEMDGKTVFIRVYSHPTIEASPYYADSEPKTLSRFHPEVPFAIGRVDNLLKPDTDSRGDGLTDRIREQLFGSASVDVFAPMEDGRTIWDHFVAGTDWQDPGSFLAISSIRPKHDMVDDRLAVVGEILEWASQTGRIYTIQYATNLIFGEFMHLSNAIGLPATPPLNVFTNLDIPAAAPIYYRVEVEWPDMPEEAAVLIDQ